MKLTDFEREALAILREGGGEGVEIGYFAARMWPEKSGKGILLAAGGQLGRLEKKGLLRSEYLWDKWLYYAEPG
jgi:hypothetical protein